MTHQNIHPTAIIHEGAQIGAHVEIGPYCIVGPHVQLGDHVNLHAHVVVDGHTKIGDGTQIYPFAAIGTAPQDLKYHGEPSQLVIGKNNVIREHVTMHPGTAQGGMETRVGDNGLFMVGVHIAHDCQVGNHVIMANNATLGGHVHVGDHAVIGGLAAVHQWIRIGAFAMIGGMSGVENDVIPYGRVKGERAYLAGLNIVGMERHGYNKDQIKASQRAFKALFGGEGTLDERLSYVSDAFEADEIVRDILTFAREKTRFPLCQPPHKAA